MGASLWISIIILICVFIVYLIALYQRMKFLNNNCNFGQNPLKNLFGNKLTQAQLDFCNSSAMSKEQCNTLYYG
jgi:uncharacterized protein YneF (UPF0154 family)